MKQFSINLIVGDWGGDGHEKTEAVAIISNISTEDILKAYKKATKKIGFNFIEQVASDYEDHLLSTEQVDRLQKAGVDLDAALGGECDKEDNGWSLMPISYAEIFLAIVKSGDPDFEAKILKDRNDHINIGGYGLFY